MAIAKLRIAVEDPLVAQRHGLQWDSVEIDDEPFFLDGPTAAQVAIVDRDSQSGRLAPPVRWLPQRRSYAIPDDLGSPEAIAVSVFGTILETLSVFQRPDVLGHRIRWQFNSSQLLVVPRAGIWANAFYDRYSRSLQFFSFDSDDGRRIHTALSRDIVAHETGHAVVDALLPALYDALNPETLGLHEAIADLTAIVMALQSRQVRNWLVREHGGRLDGDTPVSQLATEFGWARRLNRPLRNASNSKRLDDVPPEPHRLAEVLTGAVWAAVMRLHASALERAAADAGSAPGISGASDSAGGGPEAIAGQALGISALRIARILFRTLDYLPPAEATFADYARALLRSDTIAYPADETGYRDVLRQEFVDRRIVGSLDELRHDPDTESIDVDLNDVLESDWAAYAFVERERDWLGLPRGRPFRLFPRRLVQRRYYVGGGRHEVRREMVLQVTWEHLEANDGVPASLRLPPRRAVFHGTTLVLGADPDPHGRYPVLSCLTTDRAARHAATRSETIRRLAGRGQLDVADSWQSFAARHGPLAPVAFARVADQTLRLRSTARLLHLAESD
ncbi:MAG: hypothetical protein HY332_13840 [Chloroflexi bacterium]|nr:hypothetical protein [Chloroflexota bacterium]